jgi:hypothetical protein
MLINKNYRNVSAYMPKFIFCKHLITKSKNIMEAAVIGAMIFAIVFGLGIVILISIFYFLNLQKAVKAAAPENRKLAPGNVWIMMIPLIGTIYSFIAIPKISDTIAAEYKSKGQPLETARPTYGVGMAMAITRALGWLFSFMTMGDTMRMYSASFSGNVEEMTIYASQQNGVLSSLNSLVGLVWFVVFIIYWVQTAGYKNKMRALPNNTGHSEIFGTY